MIRLQTILIASLLLLASCEREKPAPTGTAEESPGVTRAPLAEAAPVADGRISLVDWRVAPGPGLESDRMAPTGEQVEAWFRDAVGVASALTVEPREDRMRGVVLYNARVIGSLAEGPVGAVFLRARFERVGGRAVGSAHTIEAEVLRREPLPQERGEDARRLAELVGEAVAELVRGLDDQAAVLQADDAALVALLRRDTLTPAARQLAIQEAAERNVTGAVPVLLTLLQDAGEDIALASAAALVRLDTPDGEHARELLRLAERWSRERRHDALVQLIYILGRTRDEAVRTYLQTVAEAHEHRLVRVTAREALEAMPPEAGSPR